MRPTEAMEPAIPQAGGGSAMRTALYAVLAAMLLAGVWVRFNNQIAAVAPGLAAGPAAAVADRLPGSVQMRGLIETDLVPLSETQAAVAAMGLGSADAALLTQAVERRGPPGTAWRSARPATRGSFNWAGNPPPSRCPSIPPGR